MRSASAATSAGTSAESRPDGRERGLEHVDAAATPGTSVGYCIARNRPAWARSHGAMASTSAPSRVTVPPSTS